MRRLTDEQDRPLSLANILRSGRRRGRSANLAVAPKSTWNGWSPGSNNARFQPADAAGLSIDQVRGLKLKWAFGFEDDVTAYAPPGHSKRDRHHGAGIESAQDARRRHLLQRLAMGMRGLICSWQAEQRFW
jgi:hypothetical protein